MTLAGVLCELTEAVRVRVCRQVVAERTESSRSDARSVEGVSEYSDCLSVYAGRVDQPTKTLVPVSGPIGVGEAADSGHPLAEGLDRFCQGRILEVLTDLLSVSNGVGLGLGLGEQRPQVAVVATRRGLIDDLIEVEVGEDVCLVPVARLGRLIALEQDASKHFLVQTSSSPEPRAKQKAPREISRSHHPLSGTSRELHRATPTIGSGTQFVIPADRGVLARCFSGLPTYLLPSE